MNRRRPRHTFTASVVWVLAAGAALAQAPRPKAAAAPLPLRAVHQVCVASLGDTVAAHSAQALLIAALAQSMRVSVVEECREADADVRCVIEFSERNESQSDSERDSGGVRGWQREVPRQSAAIAIRLVDSGGHVLWADAEQSTGSLTADAIHAAVQQAAQKLLAALGQ